MYVIYLLNVLSIGKEWKQFLSVKNSITGAFSNKPSKTKTAKSWDIATNTIEGIKEIRRRVTMTREVIKSNIDNCNALSASLDSIESGKATISTPKSTNNDTDNPFGNKIWGLKVRDIRILFTIKIRDILFGYIARCMDAFQVSKSNDSTSKTENKVDQRVVRSQSSNISTNSKGNMLSDFLIVPNDDDTRDINESSLKHLINVSPLPTNRSNSSLETPRNFNFPVTRQDYVPHSNENVIAVHMVNSIYIANLNLISLVF